MAASCCDDDGVVTGFVPRGAAAPHGSYHFIGVQVAHADAFRHLPPGEPANSIGGAYDALIAARRGSVRGFVSDAAFWDIGTPEDYATPRPNSSEKTGVMTTMTDQRSR